MKIILGSTTEKKIKIIKDCIADAEIIPVRVESGITDQPLDEETTIRGAINRAQNAIIAHHDVFDVSVGLEGGLSFINGLYNLVCVVSVVDNKGRIYVGVSKKLPLPRFVSVEIENGKQFGDVIREYESSISDKQLAKITKLVQELISRQESFTEAVLSAYMQFEFADQTFK